MKSPPRQTLLWLLAANLLPLLLSAACFGIAIATDDQAWIKAALVIFALGLAGGATLRIVVLRSAWNSLPAVNRGAGVAGSAIRLAGAALIVVVALRA